MSLPVIRDRKEVLFRHARSGRVLDVGCVDARIAKADARERIVTPGHLFRELVQLNPQVVGLDIDPSGVEALKAAGFNCICANVESMDLGERFDAIIAGELIEHLENPGLFLRSARRHLKPQGVLVITTPNCFYQGWTWKIWRYGRPCVHEEHMGWQDACTLRALLERTGFQIVESCYVQPRRSLLRMWKVPLRSAFAHTLLFVARPADRTTS